MVTKIALYFYIRLWIAVLTIIFYEGKKQLHFLYHQKNLI